jgi:uncharacterized phage infection (PIP) family protein YhgE
LAEIQNIQSQYQQDVMGAQGRLTQAQTSATSKFSDLSKQYETQLRSYQDELTNYNQRANQFAARVDQYINTISQIESATRQNTQAMLFNFATGGKGAFGEPAREFVTVPATPEDPGDFTERFTRAVPQAPQAPSFEQDITRFKQESEQAKVSMQRELGERQAASMRARRRMTDRPLLSGE